MRIQADCSQQKSPPPPPVTQALFLFVTYQFRGGLAGISQLAGSSAPLKAVQETRFLPQNPTFFNPLDYKVLEHSSAHRDQGLEAIQDKLLSTCSEQNTAWGPTSTAG